MRRRDRVSRHLLQAGFVLFAAAVTSSGAANVSPQRIPDIHAPTLAGVTASLPGDLHGRFGILVLGFSKQSSQQCHAWDDQIERDFGGDPRVVYYQMPVLADVPGLLRGIILRIMSRDLPAPARARFLPLLQDEAVWKSLTGFGPGDDAYVLLIDASGQVKWHTHGLASAPAYAALKSSVAALEK